MLIPMPSIADCGTKKVIPAPAAGEIEPFPGTANVGDHRGALRRRSASPGAAPPRAPDRAPRAPPSRRTAAANDEPHPSRVDRVEPAQALGRPTGSRGRRAELVAQPPVDGRGAEVDRHERADAVGDVLGAFRIAVRSAPVTAATRMSLTVYPVSRGGAKALEGHGSVQATPSIGRAGPGAGSTRRATARPAGQRVRLRAQLHEAETARRHRVGQSPGVAPFDPAASVAACAGSRPRSSMSAPGAPASARSRPRCSGGSG